MSRTRWLLGPALALALLSPAACSVPEEPEPTDAAPGIGMEQPVEDKSVDKTVAEGLGSPDEPILMGFVPSGDQQAIVTGGEEIARLLSEETGLAIQANADTSHAAVIEAMGAENAHVAWLDTFDYLLAHERYDVLPLLVTERSGTTSHAGEIIAGADSGIDSLDDLVGKRFCRPDARSTSGWLIPSITMRAAGVEERDLGEIVDVGSHDGVVTAVYNGDCDAGGVLVDARDSLEDQYPDVRDAVVVIEVTDEIPNDIVSVLASLSPELADRIKNGLLAISMTEAGRAALQTTYGIEALQEVDDTFYNEVRATLEQAGLSVDRLTSEE